MSTAAHSSEGRAPTHREAGTPPPEARPPATSLVSVIAPCRNERAHVAAFCEAVAAQRLPPGVALELLIADGRSSDGGREWLEAQAARDPRLRCIDNPGLIVSAGLNRCLAQARGEVIVRMDLHTRYAPDYIAECLAALARTGADNVGGPWRAIGGGAMQSAIAAAFQSRWVAGGARSRDLAYEGPADTVYLGCWPRASLDRFGGFDEALVRNQDDEHNLRIHRGGGRVWQSARIRSAYQPRATLAQLFRQQLQYGYWKPFVMRKHGQAAALRQLVPGGLVGACALLALLGLALPLAWRLLGGLLALYAAFVVACSVVVAGSAGWALLWRLPGVIAVYHWGYGLGSLRGWFDLLVRARPSPSFGTLTR